MFHIYTDRVGLHEFLQIVNYDFSYQLDNSILIPAKDQKARTGLSQYIARQPVSLNKIIYIPEKAKVLYKTKYNDYFGENIQLFTAADFIGALTQHVPPKHKNLIRYYVIYSSRSRGKAKKDG
ncbi:MAG: transposase, partial [Candidatus Bathyarchaeota archaeon]|nr:transposase [Candidatus Bathyarchaeota archaeon]